MSFADDLKKKSDKLIAEEKITKFSGLNVQEYANTLARLIQEECTHPTALKERKLELLTQGVIRDYDTGSPVLGKSYVENYKFLKTKSIPTSMLKKLTSRYHDERFLITDRSFAEEVAKKTYEILKESGFDKIDFILIKDQSVYSYNSNSTLFKYLPTGELCSFFYVKLEW